MLSHSSSLPFLFSRAFVTRHPSHLVRRILSGRTALRCTKFTGHKRYLGYLNLYPRFRSLPSLMVGGTTRHDSTPNSNPTVSLIYSVESRYSLALVTNCQGKGAKGYENRLAEVHVSQKWSRTPSGTPSGNIGGAEEDDRREV